jgi:hypothetical protein
MNWRPRQTAPTDGTPFLAAWLSNVVIAYRNTDVDGWQEWPDGDFEDVPGEWTHWMPLPSLPNTQADFCERSEAE